jgi:hypothetical protein
MEIDSRKQKDVAVFCFEQRLLSYIRSVKLVRDIGKGIQRRLTQWVS